MNGHQPGRNRPTAGRPAAPLIERCVNVSGWWASVTSLTGRQSPGSLGV